MKILFVAMSESIHSARWIKQIVEQGWDIGLFPSVDHGAINKELVGINVCRGRNVFSAQGSFPWQKNYFTRRLRKAWCLHLGPRLIPAFRARQLQQVVLDFQPDIIHSLEFQSAGYLALETKKRMKNTFPVWIATNWGSDIYYYRRFLEHERKIRTILSLCDYYSCECKRDVCLAQGLGLKGQVLPVLPNAGGFNLDEVSGLRQPGLVSLRRIVMLKGYQHWVGRALVGIAALERCADLLRNYEVVIHSASQETQQAAAALQNRTGVKITLLPLTTPHRDILAMYGLSRVALGLSLSDGISTSFLEALVMGAFPIQSFTSCADEWIEDGKGGFLVPPENVETVEAALRRALTEDDLVNQAAELNAVTVRQRLDQSIVQKQAIEYYRTVARDREIVCD